jgi:4-amino-4-deoxy-L-arabinose transferase-like glycosyltransferase
MEKLTEIINKAESYGLISISIILATILAYSVAYSGYWYTYYGDELVHVHQIYLISHGSKPFLNYFTIYSPIFHYLMTLVFLVTGFSLAAFRQARLVMIVLFAIRLFFGFKLAQKVFSRTTALLFVYIMILDPLIIYSSMQIRPDNLLMIVFTGALYLLVSALENRKLIYWFLSGLSIGLAIAVSVKIGVCVSVLSIILLIFSIRKKLIYHFLFYIGGISLALGIFILVFLLQGSASEMFIHLIVYSKAMSDGLMYPTQFGFFYNPNNIYVYGLGGKPVTWYITVILPIIGITGIFLSLIKWRHNQIKLWIITMFTLMLPAQYAFFISVKSMFLQYYLTFDWILALFAAEFVTSTFLSLKKPKLLSLILQCVTCLFFGYLVYASYPANIARGQSVSVNEANQQMEIVWKTIPKDQPVFPALLFRPLSNPVPYGFFLPETRLAIKKSFPSNWDILKNKTIRFLALSDYELQFMDPDTVAFIQENYTRSPQIHELWILK